jgi:hypothetical protein
MLNHHGVMRWVLVATFVASACNTVANPRSCIDGTCTSEEFPFCDIEGAYEGTPDLCVSVPCDPDTFEKCRGDIALTCNSTGTDFDLRECPLGCQDGVGCRVCQPNQTVCVNGAVQTCDAAGNVTTSEPCALGCFESEPRCRDIEPSNGLAQYLDTISTPMDIAFETATIDVETGAIATPDGPLVVPSFLMPAPSGGVPVRVFVVRNAIIGDVAVTSTVAVGDGFVPALAFVGTGDFVVNGGLGLSGTLAMAPGAFSSPSCDGTLGIHRTYGGTGSEQHVGGGGGAHATAGAPGGAVTGGADGIVASARSGGVVSGTPELVPLRGGCASGDLISGGGAIQLSTRGRIRILGTINAAGGDWPGQKQQYQIDGGGGGGILLEGATVELGTDAKLIAYGGGGSAWLVVPTHATDHAQPPTGGQCGSRPNCGSGGNGGGPSPPTAGLSVEWVNLTTVTSGGGGGGSGRIRINTREGAYVRTSTTVEGGVVTTGVVKTR